MDRMKRIKIKIAVWRETATTEQLIEGANFKSGRALAALQNRVLTNALSGPQVLEFMALMRGASSPSEFDAWIQRLKNESNFCSVVALLSVADDVLAREIGMAAPPNLRHVVQAMICAEGPAVVEAMVSFLSRNIDSFGTQPRQLDNLVDELRDRLLQIARAEDATLVETLLAGDEKDAAVAVKILAGLNVEPRDSNGRLRYFLLVRDWPRAAAMGEVAIAPMLSAFNDWRPHDAESAKIREAMRSMGDVALRELATRLGRADESQEMLLYLLEAFPSQQVLPIYKACLAPMLSAFNYWRSDDAGRARFREAMRSIGDVALRHLATRLGRADESQEMLLYLLEAFPSQQVLPIYKASLPRLCGAGLVAMLLRIRALGGASDDRLYRVADIMFGNAEADVSSTTLEVIVQLGAPALADVYRLIQGYGPRLEVAETVAQSIGLDETRDRPFLDETRKILNGRGALTLAEWTGEIETAARSRLGFLLAPLAEALSSVSCEEYLYSNPGRAFGPPRVEGSDRGKAIDGIGRLADLVRTLGNQLSRADLTSLRQMPDKALTVHDHQFRGRYDNDERTTTALPTSDEVFLCCAAIRDAAAMHLR